jgi:aminoglycoside phosphotransferase (APT) family kinase protein
MPSGHTPDLLLADRPTVLAFWYDDLGRTDDPRKVEFLPGGVSSIVVRVVTDREAFVVKQALGQLRVAADWFSRPERSLNEARCGSFLAEIVPGFVPEIIAVVPDRSAFVMRSAPPGTETWKDRLMRGEVRLTDADMVGRLLGRIHSASAERTDAAGSFADRSFFDELRIDPYLRYLAARAPAVAPALEAVITELLTTRTCLVHGDFSPKNLLMAPDGSVLLVDHEVAHWGHPAFDVAFVTSHLCLKAIRFRLRAYEYVDAAAAVLDGYAKEARHLGMALGSFTARVTGALLLARVDGKSPVEYLTDDDDRRFVRSIGSDLLLRPPHDPWGLLRTVREALADA